MFLIWNSSTRSCLKLRHSRRNIIPSLGRAIQHPYECRAESNECAPEQFSNDINARFISIYGQYPLERDRGVRRCSCRSPTLDYPQSSIPAFITEEAAIKYCCHQNQIFCSTTYGCKKEHVFEHADLGFRLHSTIILLCSCNIRTRWNSMHSCICVLSVQVNI